MGAQQMEQTVTRVRLTDVKGARGWLLTVLPGSMRERVVMTQQL
jgi:hypothetical protein